MNINNVLTEEISQYLLNYDCDKCEINSFLQSSDNPIERTTKAIALIENIMTVHGKQDLHKHISELLRIEMGVQRLNEAGRDHVSHAVLCFILGIYINENYLGRLHNIHVDEFQWKLSGLFHDLGYPVEIANRITGTFATRAKEIAKLLGIENFNIGFKVDPMELDKLSNGESSLILIQKRLNQWGLEINVTEEYNSRIADGKICHGIISALVLLKILDGLYTKNNPKKDYKSIIIPGTTIDVNQKYFDDDIVSACSAIFIHNFKESSFKKTKISIQTAPLAFLLKISDCLQEWERPDKKNPIGLSSKQFRIEVKEKILLLSIDNDNDNSKKEKLKDELEGCLNVECSIDQDTLRIIGK